VAQEVALAFGAGVLALFFAGYLAVKVMREPQGNDDMQSIARSIQIGAFTFLRREYTYLSIFVAVVAILIAILIEPQTSIAYLVGAIISASTGFLGMMIATRANVRTTAAAARGLNPALRVAFSSGGVMGLTVVGLGLIGLTVLFTVFGNISDNTNDVIGWITGFSFGASSIALFARVGGGIFTKAADVGADLVGKIEQGIPEDDPRNPAVIADNVGDNVGDVAGMGADLFESYVGSIIAAMAIAVFTGLTMKADVGLGLASKYLFYPMLIAAGGIASSIVGTFFVRAKEDANFNGLLWAIRRGILIAGVLVVAVSYLVTDQLGLDVTLFYCVITGLAGGVIIGFVTEYYTSYDYKPTKGVAENAQTGPATVIIAGFALGMQSTLIPVIVVSLGIFISFELNGFYGVAIAAVGMLSTLGITLATDAYGPVADNAGGIAEQSRQDPEVRERTDALDALGNTTAATGKGFAIGSAALTALALMAAFAQATKIEAADLLGHTIIVGLMIGAMLPYVFSAMTMNAVGRAAFTLVNEVRRQFREIPGIMEGTADPEYDKCIDLSTRGALREMIGPGVLAVVAPVIVGVVLGVEALAGMLIGSIVSGFMLAVTMANAGGAWDNAKKYIEQGQLGGKGSASHHAAVVGDTVGDPFKDTSGPSLNILVKLMSVVALVFVPLFEKSVFPLIGS